MLRQTLESQGDSFFATDGEHVKLGTLVGPSEHRNTVGTQREDYCRFNITVRTDDLPSPEIRAMWKAIPVEHSQHGLSVCLRISVEVPEATNRVESKKAEFNISAAVTTAANFDTDGIVLMADSREEVIFRKRADNLAKVGFLRFAERADSLNKVAGRGRSRAIS